MNSSATLTSRRTERTPGRMRCERCKPIDIRFLARRGLLHGRDSIATDRFKFTFTGDEIEARWGWLPATGRAPTQFRISIPVTFTRCNYGGRRPWFLCPLCGRRCAILHVPPYGGIGCRMCLDLGYTSELVTVDHRLRLRQQKLERGLGPHRTRPKGMHQRTYERRLRQLDTVTAKIKERYAEKLLTLLQRLRGGEQRRRAT